MKAPTELKTERLLLKRPEFADAHDIFQRYASDEEVCQYLAWPRHVTMDDTNAFIEFSQSEWERWPAGPYLVYLAANNSLIGSTGLAFETPRRASTGYVFAKDSWDKGFATETVSAMKLLATSLGTQRLSAFCHPDHRASRHVLEKSGFLLEGTLRRYAEFPNLAADVLVDVVSYSWIPNPPAVPIPD